MKYSKYLASVFVSCWLLSGSGFAHGPAGSDGQLQYNNSGKLAGAEFYYFNQSQTVDIPGNLQIGDYLGMDSGNFTIRSNSEYATLAYQGGPYAHSLMYFYPDWSVSIFQKLGVNIEDPQATLDINGYAKLKPYSEQPVSCTSSRRGTIVMNNNYDLCVCRPAYSYPNFSRPYPRRPSPRRPDSRRPDFFPTSAYRLVRDPTKKCW